MCKEIVGQARRISGRVAEARLTSLEFTGLLLLALPLSALAAGPARVERTIDAIPAPRISISNLNGHVVVKGWEKGQIHLVSTTSSPRVEAEIEVMPSQELAEKVHLTTHPLDASLSEKEKATDYVLEVPLGSSVDIRNPEGEIRVERLQGDASIDSVGAPITVRDVAGHLAVRSLAGDIRITRPSGRVEANSVCGSLHFISPASSELRAGTTSGKIVYEGDFVAGGEYQLKSWNGDVDVLTSPSGSFELTAKSIKGKVIRDPEISLRPKRSAGPRPHGGNSFAGTSTTGKATVELSSFSGTIHVSRQH